MGSKLRHQPLLEIGVPDDPLGPGQIGCIPPCYERSLDFCEVEAGPFLDRPADQQPVRGLIPPDRSAAAAMLSSMANARFSGGIM